MWLMKQTNGSLCLLVKVWTSLGSTIFTCSRHARLCEVVKGSPQLCALFTVSFFHEHPSFDCYFLFWSCDDHLISKVTRHASPCRGMLEQNQRRWGLCYLLDSNLWKVVKIVLCIAKRFPDLVGGICFVFGVWRAPSSCWVFNTRVQKLVDC
jgi:hypothetical protein